MKQAQLKYSPFTPYFPPYLTCENDIFFAIRQRDILLHHPFDSFAPVIHLLRAAANDPQVSCIYQTLYRSGVDSEIVQQLIIAAKNGKQVAVVVELRVRQDEQNNWQIAQKLQQAGVHV
ncbi:RNA degradosome polyphosphate kinase, partial [Rhizobium hidalgonense]|nr:RNA degradosome polyphosphate kinase [Rhizobium hidalgonense]